jgi:hypothetical protein
MATGRPRLAARWVRRQAGQVAGGSQIAQTIDLGWGGPTAGGPSSFVATLKLLGDTSTSTSVNSFFNLGAHQFRRMAFR